MTDRPGIPARELSDEELERQGVHAHAMRHWVFLHGTAEQFRTHIFLGARDVPMANLHLVTTQMPRHRLKPVGGHFVPDTDDRDTLGALKQGERIMQSAAGL